MIQEFLELENQELAKLYKRCYETSWYVNTTGTEEWQKKEAEALEEYKTYCSNPERFKTIEKFMQSSDLSDIHKRQLQRLHSEAVENQIEKSLLVKLVTLSSEISNKFSNFRGTVDGKSITENEVRETLLTSTDSDLRKKMWQGSKQVGKAVSEDLLELIRLRNNSANALGYDNYYEMSFKLQELDLDQIKSIFNNILVETEDKFSEIKNDIDAELCAKFNLSKDALRPWHYSDSFFQDAPAIPGSNINHLFKDAEIEKLTVDTFDLVDMDIRDMLENSDLYDRENKNQYAFCSDMDREGDIRVLCNIKNNQYWMETMLHEFGHAVYDKFIARNIPFVLRAHTHIFMTEAIAMFFGRLVKEKEWLNKVFSISQKELDLVTPLMKKMQQRQMLITARWVITFVFFEIELYKNPDQDLNKLWWELVYKIQKVNSPDDLSNPDWASKMHFTMAPVYYHNYLLGELAASQFHNFIQNNVSKDTLTKETGKYFKEKVFFDGDLWGWENLLIRSTNETLNPKYFIKQFVK